MPNERKRWTAVLMTHVHRKTVLKSGERTENFPGEITSTVSEVSAGGWAEVR